MGHLLEMRDVKKNFGGVAALKGVSLVLDEGEVLALVGENGAGKSTLMKILAGSLEASSGEIFVNEERQNFRSPQEAIQKGIRVIYQELNYYKDLSITENIFSGRLPQKRLGRIDWKKAHELAAEALKEVEFEIDPRTKLHELSMAQKQLVEIAKAVSRNNKIIVMDEPTAALNDEETKSLFRMIRRLRERRVSFIYISHRLEELFEVADRVEVIRDGMYIGEMDIRDAKRDDIIRMMVGRTIDQLYPHKTLEPGKVIFEARNITGGIVQDVSIHVRQGEIVSLFGLMGSGTTELLEEIYGVRRREAGGIFLEGKEVSIRNTQEAVKNRISNDPPERKETGLYMMQSIKKNIVAPSITELSKGWIMDKKREVSETARMMEMLEIKAKGMDAEVKSLSGGNQQKVLLGKWIRMNPKVILINEPTRGVDVGTKSEIYKILEDMCAQGVGILMISCELPEVLALSNRVYVMCQGRLSGELKKGELSQEGLMEYAIGW